MSSRSPWSDRRASKRAPTPQPQPSPPPPVAAPAPPPPARVETPSPAVEIAPPPPPPITPAPIAEVAEVLAAPVVAPIAEVIAEPAPAPVAEVIAAPVIAPAPVLPRVEERAPARLPKPPKPAKAPKPPKPKGPTLAERLRPVVARVRGASAQAKAASAQTLVRAKDASIRTGSRAIAAWREYQARPAKAAPALRLPPQVLPAALALGVVLVLSLVANGFGLVASDETPHVYLAERMAQGARAYVDFPSSRPAGLLWLLSLAARLHLRGPIAAQALAFVAYALGGVFVALAARPFGKVAQVAAPLALLWAYEPLALATHPAGETFAMPLVAAAAWMLVSGRGLVAGALLAIGVSCSLPVIFPAIVLALTTLLVDRRAALQTLAALAGGLALLALAALGLYGKAALTQPIELGRLLSTVAGAWIRVLPVLSNGAGWLLLAVAAPLLAGRALRLRAAGWLAAGLTPLVAICLSPALDRLATVPAWPLLALCGALALEAVVERYRAWSQDGAHAWNGRLALLALALALVGGGFSDRLGTVTGDPTVGRHYVRPEGAVGALARGLFWRNEFALGARPSWPTRILWRLSQRSPNIERMAQLVARQSEDGGAIFGDGRVAPLVARAAGRPFAGDLVEPALARLPADELAPFFARVQQAKPAFLVLPTRRGLVSAAPFNAWAQQRYVRSGIFEDVGGEWVDVQGMRPGVETARAGP